MPASTLQVDSMSATSPVDVMSTTAHVLPSPEDSSVNSPVSGVPEDGPDQWSAPIQSTPVDVILYIFHMGTHCDGDDGAQFPLLVSHVCSSWRDIAVNTCTLWTSIFMSSASIARSANLRVGPILPKASTFVLRSRSCPLDIKLHVIIPRVGAIRVDVAHMYIRMFITASMELMANVHTRIRTLDITTDVADTTFLATHRLLPLGLPMLERWRMRNTTNIFAPVPRQSDALPRFAEFDASGERGGWLGTDDKRGPIEALLPSLKSLDLIQINATWAKWNISGLTSLTLGHVLSDRPDMSQLHAILAKNSHSLERLALIGSLPLAPRVVTPIHRPLLVLPKLRALRVGYHAQMEAVRFFVSLQLPSLKSLGLVDLARTYEVRRRKVITNSAFASSRPLGLPNLHYDYRFDSSYLVVTLYRLCPTLLAQIESLEMINVWIGLRPQIGSDFLSASINNELIYPARFFMALSSLKTLALDGADRCVLDSLNQVVPVRDSRLAGQSTFTYPGSQITDLRILHSDYEDLQRFLCDRIEAAHSLARHPEFSEKLPIFRKVEVSVQPKHTALFKKECTTGKLRGLSSISEVVSFSILS